MRILPRNFVHQRDRTRRPPSVSADEAMKLVTNGQRVWVQGIAATPTRLLKALVARAGELQDVELMHIHTEGPAPQVDPAIPRTSIRDVSLFTGANVRRAVQEGSAGFIPIFLSEVPLLFTRRVLPVDVALVNVSPPDAHGYCSLGASVDATITAVECAPTVIAQINPNVPRTHGDGQVHISTFKRVVEAADPLYERETKEPTDVELAIGRNVAGLVEDGATLQMGIGAIPDATLRALTGHRRLGIHSEMFSDGIIDLVQRGCITGEGKTLEKSVIIGGFAFGTRRLYDFIHDNPNVQMKRISWVNSPINIMQNPRTTAINSAIEVDLTGQVCADSIGGMVFSGVGGQMDFLRGAALSEGGKPIIALPSTTAKGESKLVPVLKPGAGVVTTRAHVHFVVTEYGVAQLFGKTLQQRAEALIKIAHPRHRDALARAYREKYWCNAAAWVGFTAPKK